MSNYKITGMRVLLLASYCGSDDKDCTDDFPCDECMKMCNIGVISGDLEVIGGFDYLKECSD